MSGNAVTYRLGRNCKLYEGTAGAEAATEVTHAADVTFNATRDKIEITDRLLAATGWKGYANGLIDGTLTIQARKVKTTRPSPPSATPSRPAGPFRSRS